MTRIGIPYMATMALALPILRDCRGSHYVRARLIGPGDWRRQAKRNTHSLHPHHILPWVPGVCASFLALLLLVAKGLSAGPGKSTANFRQFRIIGGFEH